MSASWAQRITRFETLCIRATQKYLGGLVQPDDLDIDPHLPALLLGFELQRSDRRLESVDAPPWLVWWEQQCGGYACLQKSLAGVLLPLEAAERDDWKACVETLCALESDRPPKPLRTLAPTFGDPYDADALRQLDAIIAPLALPPLARGVEACVTFSSAEWVSRLVGWPVLAHEIPEQCHLDDEDAVHLVMGPRGVRHRFDARLFHALRVFFESIGEQRPLQARLVWGNSD